MRGIHKSFPGVLALRGVGLTVRSGEVLALLGENGAGKSTLMKILGGAHCADTGEILIEGKLCEMRSPAESRNARIAVIYQEFNLVPALSELSRFFAHGVLYSAGVSAIMETWATMTFQPTSGKRTQVCVCRPVISLPRTL